nr:glycosyltransferase [Clostridiales bacterium]
MTQPLVSVIIPVYNVEKYLRECMDSVLNQTLKDIEVICVDDGSTDGSLEILRAYESKDSRVKVYTQNNKFAGVARNNGFSHATGKYCIFLDSDDRFEKNLLQKTYKKAEKDQADIVAFNFDRFDEFGKVEKRIGVHTELLPKNKAVFSYKDCPEYIMSVVNPTPWTKLYRTSFIAENNLKYEEISTTNDITFASVSVAVAKRISYLKDYL